MNVGQIKNLALKLMDEYTLSGVPETGQLTLDYTNKMNSFIDMAQQEITDHVGIYAFTTIDTVATTAVMSANGYNFYALPTDMKDFRYCVVDNWPNHFNDFEVEIGMFKINTAYNNSQFVLHYFKYPEMITDATPDDTELEVDLYTQYAIPYYVAGMCLASASEDLQLSDKLMTVWSTKLNGMTKREIRYPRRAREVVWF
ncbi:hypothetical protein [Paenibacillus sp. NEAU-GSW1]|uniref:hypothetical protein n=1 Tax=Paenibacillus sp. NEAU-GSW1 TaxID=2682486 RepID=UPI0012E11390|nr:hypothetical protein [Paenibacillus sp. NEAU-GSW1]MUT66013.1 hypothetical protein [Paenibacillus sp. NEAU-GSW1]